MDFGKDYSKKFMKTYDRIKLTHHQRQALGEIRRSLLDTFDIEAIKLFGSVSRNETDEESDIDLLIITRLPLKRMVRHQITDIVCEINLKYNTNVSTLVVDQESWNTGLFSVLPLREEIFREGVAL
jgi:predicted nucleotidyltransferase